MQLSHLSDTQVEQELARYIKSEREILTLVLHHLREADRRRLFSKHGYKSLFEYAVKRLGYTEDEAYRRISAMRLLKELPQIEEKIESGALSLSNVAQAQNFFRQEAKECRARTTQEKVALIEKIENCSKSKAQAVIQLEKRESTFQDLGLSQTAEYKFRADKKFGNKLKRFADLKGLAEHQLFELFDQAIDIALEKIDPVKKAERAEKKNQKLSVPDQKSCVKKADPKQKPTRYISAAIKHQIYLRDQGKCQNCGSEKFIEIDHIKPFALTGKNSIENLRLLCRSCNQRKAIEIYGAKKMMSYLEQKI